MARLAVSAKAKPVPPLRLSVKLMRPRMLGAPAQGGTAIAGRLICVSSLLTDPVPPPVVLGDFVRDGGFASAVGGAILLGAGPSRAKQCR